MNKNDIVQFDLALKQCASIKERDTLLNKNGFKTILDYIKVKREILFAEWVPEVYMIDIKDFAEQVEEAIKNNKYGVYIPVDDGIHAYHGNDEIDYNVCAELNVKPVELGYVGGTIIGSEKDVSILVIFPTEMNMDHYYICDKLCNIIRNYVDNVIRNGNDILVNGKKVSGSMTRQIGDSFVWAAQISFADYTEYISKICHKKARKEPSYINSDWLSKETLEREFINWLQKK